MKGNDMIKVSGSSFFILIKQAIRLKGDNGLCSKINKKRGRLWYGYCYS